MIPSRLYYRWGARYVQCKKESATVRLPLAGAGDLRLIRLNVGRKNKGRIRIIPIDNQLKRLGLDDALAWSFAQKLDSLFPHVGLKVDRPLFSR